jgi:hypothetical protein
MGNRIDTRVVLGSLRYKSAPDTNLMFNVPLVQTNKENVEFDRNINIDLQQVFDDERQKSDTFRPVCKFSLLFNNSYSGSTNYPPLENNLYYVNDDAAAKKQCGDNPQNVSWSGLPQYNEFDFIRTDYNVPGYTQPPNNHITFVPKSASSYNWNFFVSYAYDNDFTKELESIDKKSTNLLQWVCGNGIPFIIDNTTFNGQNLVSFRCPVKHGLTIGEYVKFNFNYNGIDSFQVYSLGDQKAGSEEYIFNIYNVGFTGGAFANNSEGTFKRIIDIENPNDTTSQYYVRRHKILTNSQDAVLVNAGFDQNIFGNRKKFESSGFTPNQVARVSIKEGAQSYTLSFNKDIHINPIRDNQKRPISELFFTVIWKGYFGLMFGTKKNPNEYLGLKQGYEFNLPLDPSTNKPSGWWSNSNSLSNTPFPVGVYNTPLGAGLGPNLGSIPFTYIESLKEGDILDGDYCEWNESEQQERVISTLYHKYRFNPFAFKLTTPPQSPSNMFGYYYQPHYPLNIRDYSDYIETGSKQFTEGIPDYSFYSEKTDSFIWRDLYPYGYVNNGIGVNYPFMNGTHYPYNNNIFRIIPEGSNYREQVLTTDPIIDGCE